MKLYRFPYSCYALKVECLLGLAGMRAEVEDVPYGDRSALVELTGGYMHVPVLVDATGCVHLDSRAICEFILLQAPALVPAPLEGPVWAYADWCDQILEDACFKLAAPAIRRRFPRPADRALYALIKERKYGPGCVEAWEQSATAHLGRARAALAPSERTLQSSPFLFGPEPTLADAALWGQLAMVRFAGVSAQSLGASLPAWVAPVESAILAAHQRLSAPHPRS
ncbi:MAG: glutathione S-transferase family protein [Myxococcaceae bacterium]